MYINGQNLCIGCMHPLNSDGGCSFCGLKQEEYSPIPRCLRPGTELAGRYVTGKVLGEGSFGITYIGWDKSLGIRVAVKEYFPSDMVSRDVICGSGNHVYLYENKKKTDYDSYLEKFLNEAKCLSKFNQLDGVVSVREFFYENNTAYIVMQYVDGISVKEYIHTNGKLPASQLLEKMQPVLLALERVHNTGIVHRDISPDNLMIKEDGSLVLIDFGAARMRNIGNTKTMTVMFKRGFSPKEQYQFKGKWGAYTDVYSICATMYFMMTGTPPNDSLIRALGDDMPSLVSMKKLDIPVWQCQAIMKGMAVSAEDRWQSIGELRAALQEEKIPEQEEKKPRGNFKKILTGACVLVLAGGLALGWGLKVRVPERQAERQSSAETASFVTKTEPDSQKQKTAESETSQPSTLLLNDMTGMSKAKAEKELKKQEDYLTTDWKEAYSETVKKGQVISQSLPEGTELVKGVYTKLVIVVSKGRPMKTVPKLTGLNETAAIKKLKKDSFRYEIKRVESDLSVGSVLGQSVRAGKKVKEKTRITVTVSKGRSRAAETQPENSGFAGVIE